VLGVTNPGWNFVDKQVWWWNEEVQPVVQEKKKAIKKWVRSKSTDDYKTYKARKTEAKSAVAKAKAAHHDELYKSLETSEGVKKIYRLAVA